MIVKVGSEKDPNVQYAVNLETGECSCPFYQHRLKEENKTKTEKAHCKHFPTAVALARLTP